MSIKNEFRLYVIPPESGGTVFCSKEAVAYIEQGRLTISDPITQHIYYQYTIASDLKLRRTGGFIKIMFLNGKKSGGRDHSTELYFYNPARENLKFGGFSPFFCGKAQAKEFAESCKFFAGVN